MRESCLPVMNLDGDGVEFYVDVQDYPIEGRCCGLEVREIPRLVFDSLHKQHIPLQIVHESGATRRFLEGSCEWFAVSYGFCELEVTPMLSKMAAAYLGYREGHSLDFDEVFEVWHVTDWDIVVLLNTMRETREKAMYYGA